MIINGRKLTEADYQETTIIELLAKAMNSSEEEIVNRLKTISNILEKLPRIKLYHQGIDYKAITWIKGLYDPSAVSYAHFSKNGSVSYNTKKITPLEFPDTPIKILDATGDANALKPLVRRSLKTVRADVAWDSHRVHIKINTNKLV